MRSTHRVRSKIHRRRHFTKLLEDRRLQAADAKFSGPIFDAAVLNTTHEVTWATDRVPSNVNAFGEGLRQAFHKISRVIEAISSGGYKGTRHAKLAHAGGGTSTKSNAKERHELWICVIK